MNQMLQQAKDTKPMISRLTPRQKNDALYAMADALTEHSRQILDANTMDLQQAQGKTSQVMLDQLLLTQQRIEAMAQGLRNVAALPDPVGQVLHQQVRPDGLQIQKISVPMGVIAIIYESRPNVTSDAAALALKSGNVCILHSGKEAFKSAQAIVNALHRGLKAVNIPETAINLVQDTSHDTAAALMTANGYIDLLIPQGGAGLIRTCLKQATVPCIAAGTGICHIYVEKTADLNTALTVIDNAKTSRPSVCNAAEVLLVDKSIAPAFLPMLYERLVTRKEKAGLPAVELRLDEYAASIIPGTAASDTDFDTEFLDYILAVKCVNNTAEAICHISAHSTGHSEAIITRDIEASTAFISGIDSAAVYVNASTRFTDGGEFGLGCEMGISTQKLHTRGPIGLQELTTYKYVIRGSGQIR